LGQKYGITNIGTAEGNTALLNALKSGQQPGQQPSIVQGSITPQVEQTDTSGIITQNQDQSVSGSVLDASGGIPAPIITPTPTPTPETPTTPPILPEIADNKAIYVAKQNAVLDIDKEIKSRKATLDSAMESKIKEIAMSGGIVDAAQLRSMVLTESEPLVAEIKDLQSQRSQLVGEQNIAGKAYQDSLNNQKQSDANFYKQQTADLAAKKELAQETQFAQNRLKLKNRILRKINKR